MHKQEFLEQLRRGLSGLPQDDVEERLTFYSEMIDDRMEEGLSEEEAMSGIGTVDTITAQIIADIPLTKLVKERMTPNKRLKVWETVLLVLGSPIWISLTAAAFAAVLAIYASLWSVIVCLWAVFGALICCSGAGMLLGVYMLCVKGLPGIAVIGAGIVCAGLSVFLFFACKAATKGAALLTKKIALGIKHCFINKEEAQ